MGLFGAAHIWGAKALPSLKSATYHETWQLYLTYRRSKNHINLMAHTLSFADISIFLLEISNFCYIKKYGHRYRYQYFLSL